MIRTLIAGAFALLVATPASAGDDMATRQPKADASSAGATTGARFDQLDTNHDGFISRDEGKDAEELHTRFTELDTNNDNKLSRDEYNALNKNARGASGATGSNSK